jgi:nucleosome assembly protein 1-like 1
MIYFLSCSDSPPKFPEVEDIDEDEAAALEEAFDRDYDVAQSLRSHIIPQAVLWFTGEALEDDDDDDENAAQDGAEEGGNIDDGGLPPLLGSNPFGQPPLAPGENPPECKQN